MGNYKKIKSFTDLIVWQKAHKLSLMIYLLTKEFPREELYSLVDQMRRAMISVTSNIAEGFGRQTLREKIQFYYMASGSLTELKNQILLAKDLNYLESDLEVFELCNDVHRLLNGLITATKSRIV